MRFPLALVITALMTGSLPGPAPAHAQANNFADLALSLHHDDNLSRAFLSSDRFSDSSLDLGLSAGRLYLLPNGQTATVFGMLEATRFHRLDGLDNVLLGGGASYNHRFGLGAYAPELNLSLSVARIDSEGRVRDRDEAGLQLRYGKRLSPALAVEGGLRYSLFEGSEDDDTTRSPYSPSNDLYDFDETALFATADYVFANQSALSLTYTYAQGDTISTALAPNPPLLAISRALAVDPGFEAPAGRNYVAYALDTSSHSLALDWSIPVGRDSSLSLGISRQQIDARRGVSYSNDRVSVGFIHAF